MSTRFLYFFLAVGSLVLISTPTSQAATSTVINPGTSAPTPTPAITVDPTSRLISEAIIQMNKNDADGALVTINKAIQMDPKIPGSYVLRASIYYQKKQWPEAEADFQTASDLSPKNVVIKFNLVEIKFLQKKYDDARAGYVSLQNDPDLGDLATFKIFLCDVLGKHDDIAAKELATFNKADGNPSYYYSNAVWAIKNGKIDEARTWLDSAHNIYSDRKNTYYLEAMNAAGFVSVPSAPSPKQ